MFIIIFSNVYNYVVEAVAITLTNQIFSSLNRKSLKLYLKVLNFYINQIIYELKPQLWGISIRIPSIHGIYLFIRYILSTFILQGLSWITIYSEEKKYEKERVNSICESLLKILHLQLKITRCGNLINCAIFYAVCV